jgi:hypothetical protein
MREIVFGPWPSQPPDPHAFARMVLETVDRMRKPLWFWELSIEFVGAYQHEGTEK